VVKKLLKQKVDVNAVDMHGVTPILALCYGVTKEQEDVCNYIASSYRLKSETERAILRPKEDATIAFREIFGLLAQHKCDFAAKDNVRQFFFLKILVNCFVSLFIELRCTLFLVLKLISRILSRKWLKSLKLTLTHGKTKTISKNS